MGNTNGYETIFKYSQNANFHLTSKENTSKRYI